MADLTFVRLETSSFYVLSETDVPQPDYCIAFLTDADADGSPVAALTLAQTWEMPGLYLFLGMAPGTLLQTSLEAELRQWQQLYPQARLLWIENPAAPSVQWRQTMLGVTAVGAEEAIAHRLTTFDLRNYTLGVAGGSSIALNADKNGWVLTCAPDNPQGFYLETGLGAHRLLGIRPQIAPSQTDPPPLELPQIALPLTGETAGCLRFDLILHRPAADSPTYTELVAMDVGLRMFFKDSTILGNDTDFAIASNRYPLFGEDHGALAYHPQDLTLYAMLDPLNPLDGRRSYFGLVHPQTGRKPDPIPSGYRTNIGYTVYLTPRDRHSRLVFAERPQVSQVERVSDRPDFYLVPSGEFELSVPPQGNLKDNPLKNLLCGFSGVEYFKLDPAQTNVLYFQPGRPAFAPGFVAVGGPTQRLLERVGQEVGQLPEALNWNAELAVDLKIQDAARQGIVDALLYEFFPPGHQLNSQEQANLFTQRTLNEFITWFQELLRTQRLKALSANGAAPLTTLDATGTLATTAWAYVRQTAQPPIYYAQPEQAILYQAPPPTTVTAEAANPSDDDSLLRFMEVPTTVLPQSLDGGSLPLFPLMPYGGVQGTMLTDYQKLEVELLNPQRRSVIRDHADHETPFPAAPDGQTPTGTTPQGLLTSFSDVHYSHMSLVLAKDTDGDRVQLQGIERRSPLRAALQSNQLFLVINNVGALEDYFQTDNQLTIQGWTFDLSPASWQKHGTVFIFKFFDQPLIELLNDPQRWSQSGEDFVTNLDETRLRLLKLFQDAIDRVNQPDTPQKDRENYGPLARIARTAVWSGILALNVPVPSENLPEELLALAAGIDEDQFYGQYIGIETTPIVAKNRTLDIGQSSLFGLIDYQNETVPLPNNVGYDFEVRNLRVLFQNSLVKAFSSEIAITLDRLFDETTKLVGGAGDRNIVLLKGTAENHNGKTTYAFSFSGENHFTLPYSKVLEDVQIIKAQFATDPVTRPITENTQITGRFTFWGRLNFKTLGTPTKPFDVLSFGADPPPAPPPSTSPASPAALLAASTNAASLALPNDQFLSFSNLAVTLSFKKGTPENRTFAFDPHHLVFDPRRSKVRRDSLYAKFPLKLTGLLYSPGDKQLNDLGYMPVKTPLPGKLGTIFKITPEVLQGLQGDAIPAEVQEALSHLLYREFGDQKSFLIALSSTIGPESATTHQEPILKRANHAIWYALTFDLQLGELGALAGKAGLVASLMLAWSPGAQGGTFVGLRLPGSTGGKREISLQGVIKIAFKSIDLIAGKTREGQTSYLLRLKNIVLKFLLLSIPPNARTEFILFGNPEMVAQPGDRETPNENNTVGWYAAYIKEE